MKNIPVRLIQTPMGDPNFGGSFSIRNIGDLLTGEDMVQTLHRHDYFYILAIKKGTGHHVIDFTPFEIHDHTVFFMRPGQVHQLTLNQGSQGFVMQFKSDFYYPNDKASGQILQLASTKKFCQLDSESFKKLFELLSYIFQEYTDKREGYQEVIKANLGIFFIELVRHRKNDKMTSTGVNPYSQQRFEEFSILLETHIVSHKQVSQYAEMLHISTYQLNAITKDILGKTCSELINDYCILESKRHLLATSSQINQIAATLGFEDVSYFIRFFKKHTGYSPEAFRQNFK
ncbi:MAG: AraC family transcriptional regulator [Bacteroidetes bacterium]|nr:AraC family transcriptional regulator [Bacteroidota bacterium]